jgi:RND family efflux transporter MFP subunit
MHPLRLRLAVPERAAARIRPGQEVRVRVGGDPNVYLGRVARLSPAIEESNRTLMIEAEVPNEGSALRPGTFASAEIVISSDRPIVVVPSSAVVTLAGIEKVIAVQDGKAVEKLVRAGRRFEDRTEIVDGISAGEIVVVEPGNLVGGQAVKVAP